MFGYPDDIRCTIENEELSHIEQNYASNRKNSFIDLLSYNKFNHEPNIEDLQNLDSLLNGSITHELHYVKSQGESVQLMLDVYPDITYLTDNRYWQPDHSKIHQKSILTGPDHLVGSLTIQERSKKIQKYLAKKKKRTWAKKIHYDCRKKVADNRLRVKGRFVTRNKTTDIKDYGTRKPEAKIN